MSILVALVLALLAPRVSALELAREEIPASEAADIVALAAFVTNSLMESVAVETAGYRRAFHSKAHACLRASFTVNHRLPAALKVGVFAQPKRYDAWLRLSNGLPGLKSDRALDTRGFALKLLGVEGPKLLAGHEDEKTQDFLLSSGRVFFLRNVRGFLEVGVPLFTSGRVPAGFDYERQLIDATTSVESHLLRIAYSSQTPYLLGPGQAVKYRVLPCPRNPASAAGSGSDNFLATRLGKALSASSACFRFQVQRQTDPASMPIEDPTIEWSPVKSPFIDVAAIDIPLQQFEKPEQYDSCENLSFNPWHSLPEHRPLGGINRARKVIYDAGSAHRHLRRGVPEQEPLPDAPLRPDR